ncbi:MAG: hypothetical protein IT348_10355 [Candidatus Eisenbacteria bacterium]|nr:hypothetical protein [Candidatus Eisenbacteria bacterium]
METQDIERPPQEHATTDEEAAAFVARIAGSTNGGNDDEVTGTDKLDAPAGHAGGTASHPVISIDPVNTDAGGADGGGGGGSPKTGVGIVRGALADARPAAPNAETPPEQQASGKKSPARRRVELQRQANGLRGQARTRRAALAMERAKEEPDASRIAQLEREIDELDAQLLKIDVELEQRMERDARRADRDRAIRALDRDPTTGKRRKGPYTYDPRTPEMQTLYADKKTPHLVFADGAKLIRNDGGQYGLAGGILRALLDGADRAGEKLSPRLQVELTKALCWDALERIHGIGAGYCRDAAWIVWLWAQLTSTPLDLAALPQRKPLPEFGDWVTAEFGELYVEALTKLGIAEATGSDVAVPEAPPDAAPSSSDGTEGA